MNLSMAVPIELRLTGCFIVGVLVAGLLNLLIYRLAWTPRPISPWSPAPQGAGPRTWLDRIPIIGWLRLRREAAIHGKYFWVRPLLVEIALGAGFAALYWWEIEKLGLFPVPVRKFLIVAPVTLHVQLLVHLVLICLMTVTAFIDIDDKTIPDQIVIPGALLGLLAAAVLPWSLLPATFVVAGQTISVKILHVCSPDSWPAWLDGSPRAMPLLVGLGCWWGWCLAILPWIPRYGLFRALRLMALQIVRRRRPGDWAPKIILGLGVFGTLLITLVWWQGNEHWKGLLSSLVGLVAASGVVWMVRIVGTTAFRKEAMGFGDVTLMAMIGAFLGWQCGLMVFFLAPFAGLVVGLLQWMIRRDNVIPFGPYLCLAALVLIVFWAPIWSSVQEYFFLGWLIPAAIAVCMLPMGLMLWLWRIIKTAWFGETG